MFKVNEEVRVKEDLIAGEYYGEQLLTGTMKVFCGTTATITSVDKISVGSKVFELYTLSCVDIFSWTEEMLVKLRIPWYERLDYV